MPVVALELTRVDMTAEDAALFYEFQRHYTNIKRIIGSGALGTRNSTFTCHVDGHGTIRRIDRIQPLFTS